MSDINQRPVPVRVVLQGGGARLIALMAALEELEKFTSGDDPKLRITGIAGTSAGAIAAIMLASKKDLSTYREDLCRLAPSRIKKIFNAKSKAKIAAYLLAGWPILDEEELRRLLTDLFKDKDEPIDRYGKLSCEFVRVIATDLRSSERRSFGEKPSDEIIDSLVHSCAIPFVFRTHRDRDLLVDGGICSNLPALDAIGTREPGERILAFSFVEEEYNQFPRGLVQYAKALLLTAMNNSVKDACAHVSQNQGEVCALKTEITTFDFDRALAELNNGTSYQNVQYQVREWLNKKIPSWNAEPIALEGCVKGDVVRVYNKMRAPSFVILRRMGLLITANCLLDSDVLRPDEIEQVITLQPVDRPLVCFRLGIMATGATPVKGMPEWFVEDKHGNIQNATVINTTDSDDVGRIDSQIHHAILFFHPPLDPRSGPYRIRQITFQENTMSGLGNGGTGLEWATNFSSQSNLIEEAYIIVRVPFEMRELFPDDLGKRLWEIPAAKHPKSPDGTPVNWAPGRRMTPEELLSWPSPNGFVPYGWKAQNVQFGQYVGMLLRRPMHA